MANSSSISPLRILGLCAFFLLSACQQKSEAPFTERSPAPPPQDLKTQSKLDRAPSASVAPEQFQDVAANGDIFTSAAALPGAIDSLKKFVRTAQMRFRVKNIKLNSEPLVFNDLIQHYWIFIKFPF